MSFDELSPNLIKMVGAYSQYQSQSEFGWPSNQFSAVAFINGPQIMKGLDLGTLVPEFKGRIVKYITIEREVLIHLFKPRMYSDWIKDQEIWFVNEKEFFSKRDAIEEFYKQLINES
jgi:hypothetical protein